MMVDIDPQSEPGDVTVVCKDGTTYTGSTYKFVKDYVIMHDGMEIHLGPAIIVEDKALLLSTIDKVKAKVRRVQEITVWGNDNRVPTARLKRKEEPEDAST